MNTNLAPFDPAVTPRQASTTWIYAVVLSVGVLCSLAIVTTYEVTRPMIARNKISQRRAAITDVIPEATTIVAFAYDATTGQFREVSEESQDAGLVFAGFNATDKLLGLVAQAEAMGYQDTIRLLYGYDPASQSVIGIRVLESRETPGLGDRIETDANFLRNFEQLSVHVGEDGERLQNEIEFVKSGNKTDRWQIDGITGATISSRAVAEALRRSTSDWVPRIQRDIAAFQLPSISRPDDGEGS